MATVEGYPAIWLMLGASPGLLFQQQRGVGSERSAVFPEEWVLDAALMQEMRSLEEHVAREGRRDRSPNNNVNVALKDCVVSTLTRFEIL